MYISRLAACFGSSPPAPKMIKGTHPKLHSLHSFFDLAIQAHSAERNLESRKGGGRELS